MEGIDTVGASGTALWEALLDHVASGVIVYRLDSRPSAESLRLVAANAVAQTMLGLDLASKIGSTILEVFPSSVPERRELVADAVRTGKVVDLGERTYAADTEEMLFSTRAVPLP